MCIFEKSVNGETIEVRTKAICKIAGRFFGTSDPDASVVLSRIALDGKAEPALRWCAYIALMLVHNQPLSEEHRPVECGFRVPEDFDMKFLDRCTAMRRSRTALFVRHAIAKLFGEDRSNL